MRHTREGKTKLTGGTGKDAFTVKASSSTKDIYDAKTIPYDFPGSTGHYTHTILGDVGDNVLIGGDRRDMLIGFSGNDTIFGNGNDDLLYGDEGRDYLEGGSGNDVLDGGTQNDFLIGGLGNDYLYGREDNDTLYGGTGDDNLHGDAGNDVLDGGYHNDMITGGLGNDTIKGGFGNDVMAGGAGRDVFVWDMDEAGGSDQVGTIHDQYEPGKDILYFHADAGYSFDKMTFEWTHTQYNLPHIKINAYAETAHRPETQLATIVIIGSPYMWLSSTNFVFGTDMVLV